MGKGRRGGNPFKGRSHTTTSFTPVEQQRTYVSTATHIRKVHVVVPVDSKPPPPPSTSQYISPHEDDFGSADYGTFSIANAETLDNDTGGVKVEAKKKAKRYEDSDAPLLTWKEHYRDSYLDAMMRTEGRGRFYTKACCRCGGSEARFRCKDCFGLRMYCQTCTVLNHLEQPLHCIEEWTTRSSFQAVTLRDLGLQIQLGHPKGQSCETPGTPHKDFLVMAWNGIHLVDMQFCGCPNALDRYAQLLEVGWFPTSFKEPQSAATFQLLRNFQILNEQGKLPATDFYASLEQIVDGTGLVKLPNRLEQLMLVVRQWRHLRMGKRCGRAHDPTGLSGTTSGSAAVLCRACPQPGKNLPEGWDRAPPHQAWLYNLILSQDANFKQKARARANDARDAILAPGWAFVVDHKPYIEEIAKRSKDQEEISHCVGFSAIWAANTKKSRGLRATGIGSVSCARHELFRPNGIGDLQKGERYVNMDYIFLATLAGSEIRYIIISYDIACQWMINFFLRMLHMPERLRLPPDRKVVFKVPKFHLPAHKEKCYARFALNFTEGTGKVDGEAPERGWSTNNESARSLSMMTLGARWEAQDSQCNFWNQRKMINLENSLLKKLVSAITDVVIHQRSFAAFQEALAVDNPSLVSTWLAEVEAWERDHNKPCPYDLPNSNLKLKHVKKALAEEEFQQEIDGTGMMVNRSGMIVEGVDIEDAQRSLSLSIKHNNRTLLQQTTNQKRQTALLVRIRTFRKEQAKHFPAMRPLLESLDLSEKALPHYMKLHLPSSDLPEDIRPLLIVPDLVSIESRLREAQAAEALLKLQGHLRARSLVSMYRDRRAKSQAAYTRHRALEDQLTWRIQGACETYRAARASLLRLLGPGDWMKVFQELRDEDVRAINERLLCEQEKEQLRQDKIRAGLSQEEAERLISGVNGVPTVTSKPLLDRGESKRIAPSWIWFKYSEDGSRDSATTAEIEASLKVEWCKARARARRSREELLLVEEEMRRSIAFCYSQSQWWLSQMDRRKDIDPPLTEGLNAYAIEQTFTERRRAELWTKKWHDVRIRAREVLESLKEGHEELAVGRLQELVVELDLDDEEDKEVPVDIHMDMDEEMDDF
ncbi:hypothetical protein VNI00_013152 [Paramarasmius palmivorus]|uniref:CxC2-like cysteine cluster KDZ transposase-associated domain-containing protein n=1 Tax=Paramarasmius palmivorus TaxID=297713 RepID=A0AAW0BZP1_9AGAR